MSQEDEKLVYVEFDGDKPFEVWTDSSSYNVDFSKAHGLLYAESGSWNGSLVLHQGTTTIFWAAPGAKIVDEQGQPADPRDFGCTRLEVLPKTENGFDMVTLQDLVVHYGMTEVEDTVFCSICDDWLPTHDGECQHLFWSNLWGVHGGTGACDHEAQPDWHREPLLAFVEAVACREDMIQALEARKWTCAVDDHMLWQEVRFVLNDVDYSNAVEQALEDMDEAQTGFGWLLTLDLKTTEKEIELTLDWLRAGETVQKPGFLFEFFVETVQEGQAVLFAPGLPGRTIRIPADTLPDYAKAQGLKVDIPDKEAHELSAREVTEVKSLADLGAVILGPAISKEISLMMEDELLERLGQLLASKPAENAASE